MPNVPLAYVNVYRRMSDIFHTRQYASTIRSSVTGPLHHRNTCMLHLQEYLYVTPQDTHSDCGA